MLILYFLQSSKGKVTDFVSFYCLPSSVMKHAQHKSIKAAYSYYNVADTVPLKQLMNDALILAHRVRKFPFKDNTILEKSGILSFIKDKSFEFVELFLKCIEKRLFLLHHLRI